VNKKSYLPRRKAALLKNIPLFLTRVGVRGREKTLFSGKEVFPFPENKLPLSGKF
jgi:hypothetical protein